MIPRTTRTSKRLTALPFVAVLLLGLAGSIWLAQPVLSQETEPVTGQEVEPKQEESPEPTIRRRGNLVSVFSGDVIIEENVYQAGQIFCVGGDVIIEGTVRDEVVVIGGSLRLTGSVRGSVIGVLSFLELDGASIGRELINAGGTLARRDSRIGGEIVNVGLGDWVSKLPSPFGVVGFFVFWGRVMKLVLAFVVILLLAALVPDRIRLVGDETPLRIGSAFFVGLLGYIGLWVVMLILLATVVGFPFGLLVFRVFKWLGIAGIFFAVGRGIGRSMGREMSLLGAVLLVFLPFAAIQIVPLLFGPFGWILAFCLNLLIWLFLEVPAFGMILLTRGGTRSGVAAVEPPRTAVAAGPAVDVDAGPPTPPEPAPPPEPPAPPGSL